MVDVVTSPRPVDEAAALLARWMREVHAARGACRLGVPGGSALAAVKAAREALDADVWRATRLTFVDERVVPVNSADSNRGAAERGGALTPAPGLVLPLVEDGEDGPAACARVSTAFTRDFGGALDVALLGMGEDGHVASLFPGHPALAAGGVVTHLGDSPKPPPARVTLTLGVLRAATRRLVLAMGAGKRAALARLLDGDVALPVCRLGPVTLVTDQTFP